MLANFDLEIPDRLQDALELLASRDSATLPIAGGTNLVVDLRADRVAVSRLVSLGRIRELRGVKRTNGQMRLGACTTVSDLLRSREIAEHGSALVEAARLFAGQMVRNTATVAGNIACGSPAADLVPPLMALDAELVLTSRSGRRVVPLADYFIGYKKDVRRAEELITEIAWPVPASRSAVGYRKLARRKGDAITVAGIAVSVTAANGVCTRVRIALGAVAPAIFRPRAAEQVLEGHALTPALADEAGRLAAEASNPIDDIRASAEYRRNAVHALTRRLVGDLWAQVA